MPEGNLLNRFRPNAAANRRRNGLAGGVLGPVCGRRAAGLAALASLLLTTVSAWAQQREMALTVLIQELRQQGHAIIYSSSLVHSGQRVQVEGVDLGALREALPSLGLQLEKHEGAWVITRGPYAVPEEDNPEAESAGDDTLLETVIVTGSLHRFPYVGPSSSAWSFGPDDLTLVPSLGSDAMRAALRLPGMSSVGVSAKPQIRGGLKDELLVMQDGVELLEPFHLADYHSAYSSVDHHTIETLDIYTGGFPSRYGNRMSGVMDIRNEWEQDQYNTDIGVSTFSTFLHTRGTFGEQRPSAWLLSLRHGDLTDLTDYIDTRSGEPKYADASLRLNVALSGQVDLSVGAVYANDDIEFDDGEEFAFSRIDTRYFWGSLDSRFSPLLRSRFTVSWLDFDRKKQQGSFEEPDEDEKEDDPDKGGALDHRQEIQRLALRNDWSALYAGARVELGWQAEYNRGEYRHTSLINRGELADIIGTQRLVARDLHVEPRGWSGGAYLQAEWALTPTLTIQPSLRWDSQDYYDGGREQQLSPRLGLAWEISDQLRSRVSLGRFHQPEGIHELQVLDGITRFFPPQHSDQIVAGFEWRREELEVVGEFYYKRYGDQKGRFENMFNPFVLLPEMEPDRVGLYPDKAQARGFDLDGRWRFSETLDSFFRYSYMDARDHLDGKWVDRRWSQRHTVNTGLAWQRNGLVLSLAITWHSGWRSSALPEFVPEDTVIPATEALNNTVLREYFSLDVSARKSWEIGRTRWEIYADISNLTDRKNQAGIDYDVEEVDGGYALTPDQETLLGRVPSIGITLSF